MTEKSKLLTKPAVKPGICIRGLDPDLYWKAQIAAKRARIPVYQWINNALRKALNRPE